METPPKLDSTQNTLKRSTPPEAMESTPTKDATLESEQSQSFPTPPLTTSPCDQDRTMRDVSPALSESTTLSTAPPSTAGGNPATSSAAAPSEPPRKKRRTLTLAEKEEQRKAKEAKEAEKAEKKAQKELDDAAKAEERRLKNEEKESKQRERDLKKQAKELEKQQKEEEQIKKQKSQLRLTALFGKPQTPKPLEQTTASPSASTVKENLGLESCDEIVDRQGGAGSSSKRPVNEGPVKPTVTDYEHYFLKFEPLSHSIVAGFPSTPRSSEEIETAQQKFDHAISHAPYTSQIPSLRSHFSQSHTRYRGIYQPRVREVIESLQGSVVNPVDLTTDTGNVERCRPEDLLQAVEMRLLHFAEDVRPPYCGSFTKIQNPQESAKLRRAPFSRIRTDTDYDYDSEAEWEEPEEGEDLMSDGEEDAESTGEVDEMDGFLDDAESEAAKTKRSIVTAEVPPVSTGLCWENHKGKTQAVDNSSTFDISSMKLDWLIDVPKGQINPFSTSYWEAATVAEAPASTSKADGKLSLKWKDPSMKPPRAPLQPRTNSSNAPVIVGASSGEKGPIMAVSGQKSAKAAAPKLHGAELEEFKDAVNGSNLTQIDLLKGLKSRFPKVTNDTIKETLKAHFARIGATKEGKKWHFVATES